MFTSLLVFFSWCHGGTSLGCAAPCCGFAGGPPEPCFRGTDIFPSKNPLPPLPHPLSLHNLHSPITTNRPPTPHTHSLPTHYAVRKQKRESKLVTKVIGTASLPSSLVDTAHLSILNYPAEEDGVVTDVSLRLGAVAPGDGSDWEVRIYQKAESRAFVLRGKQSIDVDIGNTAEQHIKITPPLLIRRGQFIGLVNRSGRLSLTYTRGWTMQRGALGENWDLWYLEEQPQHHLGSMTPPLLMWNGSVGWFAKMAQDPPEPRLVVPVSTLVRDMRRILDDSSTMDVTFLVGPDPEPVCAHRAIIKARCEFFGALLTGGFVEAGRHEVRIPDTDPHVFRLMLEYLYSNTIEVLNPHVSERRVGREDDGFVKNIPCPCNYLILPPPPHVLPSSSSSSSSSSQF